VTRKHSGVSDRTVHLRLFLASPGDVADEREKVRRVIDQVQSERAFRGRVSIEVVAWDQPGAGVAMEAGLTPQAAIAKGLPRPSECDLTVVILWSRIGTSLPAEVYAKPDGSPYRSGTEWELLDALAGFRELGRPAVWVYRGRGTPALFPRRPARPCHPHGAGRPARAGAASRGGPGRRGRGSRRTGW
jgi:hypothetical protein